MEIDARDLLRERGPVVTAQRLAVFRAVLDRPHVSADIVVETVRDEIGRISVQAVDDAPCPTAAENSGYEIDEAEIVSWGGCPEWVAAARDSRPEPIV